MTMATVYTDYPRIVIMRGLPGSGKSTWIANNLPDYLVCSADAFFGTPYRFDPTKLGQAHAACMERYIGALFSNQKVVVDNTNTQLWEYHNYVKLAESLAREFSIYEMYHYSAEANPIKFYNRQIHGVPEVSFANMVFRWETDNRATIIYNSGAGL